MNASHQTCNNLCSSLSSRQMLICWCCSQTIIMSPPKNCIGFGHHPLPPSQWPPCLQGVGGEDQDWWGICRWTAAGHLMEFALSRLGWGRGAKLMTTECVKIWLINPQAILPLYPSLLHLHWKEWLCNTSHPNLVYLVYLCCGQGQEYINSVDPFHTVNLM